LGVNSLFSLQAVKNDWRFTKMMGKVKNFILEKGLKGEVPLKLGALELLEFLKKNNKYIFHDYSIPKIVKFV